MKPILEVHNISKSFQQEKAKIKNTFSSSIKPKQFFALKDVSFELNRGESIGIVGLNGSGKSTLLKILANIMTPTNGKVIVRGKIAGIFELTAGFYPDLSGSKNIFFYGTILGLNKNEVRKIYNEIVEFSGLEEFIQRPVRHYSSGMKVRLAFSISIFMQPDILLIDEAFSVGDSKFKKKCIKKIQTFQKEGGSLILVNHNISAIIKLCRKAILLDKGEIKAFDESYKIADLYENKDLPKTSEKYFENESFFDINLFSYKVLNSEKETQYEYSLNEFLILELTIDIKNLNENQYNFIFQVQFSDNTLIFKKNFKLDIFNDIKNIGIHKIICEIPNNLLSEGLYVASLTCRKNELSKGDIINKNKVFTFKVLDKKPKLTKNNFGINKPIIQANFRTYSYSESLENGKYSLTHKMAELGSKKERLGTLKLISLKTLNSSRNSKFSFSINETILLELTVDYLKESKCQYVFTFQVQLANNVLVFKKDFQLEPKYENFKIGKNKIVCVIPNDLLADGLYEVSLEGKTIGIEKTEKINLKKVLNFNVIEKDAIQSKNYFDLNKPLIRPNLRVYFYPVIWESDDYTVTPKTNDTIYLVYTMAKVGTTTVSKALKKAIPDAHVFHVHFLENFWFDFSPKRMLQNVEIKNEVLEAIKANPNKKIKIITLVRDPIIREISDFFQAGNFRYGKVREHQKMEDYFDDLNNYHFIPTLMWFDMEFNNFLDFDIYNHHFDKEKGYSKYKHENKEILCLKLERFNEIGKEVLEKFVGADLDLQNANSSKNKQYANLYIDLKNNFKINERTKKKVYESKLVQHFYTKKEIQTFIDRWS